MNNKRLKRLLRRSDIEMRQDGRDMVLTRFIGHREDMPGSGQWKMQTEIEKDKCWHCDNWMYSIVFWSPKIGEYIENRYLGVQKKMKRRLMSTIKNFNGADYSSNKDVPILFCEDQNWRARPFKPILEYLDMLDHEKPVEPDFKPPIVELARQEFRFYHFHNLP